MLKVHRKVTNCHSHTLTMHWNSCVKKEREAQFYFTFNSPSYCSAVWLCTVLCTSRPTVRHVQVEQFQPHTAASVALPPSPYCNLRGRVSPLMPYPPMYCANPAPQEWFGTSDWASGPMRHQAINRLRPGELRAFFGYAAVAASPPITPPTTL